jgi:hypothetical protein
MPQASRAAKNERIYREVNERIREIQESFGGDPGVVAFVCECSRLGCTEMVRATLAEYGAVVRTTPRRFLVIRDHVDPDLETIVAQTDDYAVVEKFAQADSAAEARS